MYFVSEPTHDGFALRIEGSAWNADPCSMRFPEDIWTSFSVKEALVRELAYVNTLAIPMLLDHTATHYSTPRPHYYDLYNELFEASIPNLVEDIPGDDADEILSRFRSISRDFRSGGEPGRTFPRINRKNKRVVLPFSFGKDSLLTLAVLREMGYDVFPVLIDERVLPRVFAMKQSMADDLCVRFGLELGQVVNEIQLLSDYEILERPPTRLYQVQAYFVYIFAMLPFCAYYNAPLIALNNEYANSLNFLHRQGYLCPVKVMQSGKTTRRLGKMVEDFTGGNISVVNPIGTLGNFAIHRLLHETYPSFGGFRISCHMEITGHARWCHDCERCAHAFLFFRACGRDPFSMGFEHSMLGGEMRRFFRIFDPVDSRDEYRKITGEEEALAFATLYERGEKDPLVDLYARTRYPLFQKRRGRLMVESFSPRTHPRHPVEKKAAALFAGKLAGLGPLQHR